MKNSKTKISVALIVMSLVLCLTSCRKNEEYEYDYQDDGPELPDATVRAKSIHITNNYYLI